MNTENNNTDTTATDNSSSVSDETNTLNTANNTNSTDDAEALALTALKNKADLLGISYHPSIKSDKLSLKIKEHQERLESQTPATVSTPKQAIAGNNPRSEAGKLIRVIVNANDPAKIARGGEILGCGNTTCGMFKKYIPFGVQWHIPMIMLDTLREKKYLTFTTRKVAGQVVKEKKLMPAYSVTILDPLTAEELQEMKQRQLMAQGGALPQTASA